MPVNGVVDVILPGTSQFMCTSVPPDAIGRYLHWRAGVGYEPEASRVFAELAEPAGLTLDISAKTGFFTLMGASANQNGIVMAFEPVQSNLVRLKPISS